MSDIVKMLRDGCFYFDIRGLAADEIKRLREQAVELKDELYLHENPKHGEPMVMRHVDGGVVWTMCVECGPNVKIDEDGCCVSCGRDALHYGQCKELDDADARVEELSEELSEKKQRLGLITGEIERLRATLDKYKEIQEKFIFALVRGEDEGVLDFVQTIEEKNKRVEELESTLCRVVDELQDPTSQYWCDKPEEDRHLLEMLLKVVRRALEPEDE